MKKTYCVFCDKETSYLVKSTTKEYVVKGEKIVIDIDEAYCSHCGKKLFVYEIEKANQIKVYDTYKKRNGLLTSEEVTNIRMKYGLSQRKLANIIHCGEKNVARYENGAIQDKPIDLLIRLVDEHPDWFGLTDVKKQFLKSDQSTLDTSYDDSKQAEVKWLPKPAVKWGGKIGVGSYA